MLTLDDEYSQRRQKRQAGRSLKAAVLAHAPREVVRTGLDERRADVARGG